ncbi:MAG: DUF6159 family protein [Chloroflexia bacterium]
MRTLSNSWDLVKASYAVLRADRELLVFPFISMVGMIIMALVFSIPLFLSGVFNTASQGDSLSDSQKVLGYVLLFLFYLATYTIVIYSNVALVGAAMIRLRGGDPTASDGFRIAAAHLPQIVGYATIAATVGVALSLIRDRGGVVGRIAAGLLGFAWNIVTFLVVPVLVVENVGPVEAIKRSGGLLRRTWGEQLVANAGIGAIFFIIGFGVVLVVGVPLFLLAVAASSVALMILAVFVTILLVAFLSLFGSALSSIFQAALYMYATTGDPGSYFDRNLIAGAFRAKRA